MGLTSSERVRAKIHRILKKMPRFEAFAREVSLPDGFETEDTLLGVYHNDESRFDVWIGVNALHFWQETWQSVAYAQLVKVSIHQTNTADKHSAVGVVMETQAGSSHVLRIDGGTERFRDAWEFLRFLMRVRD